MGSSQRKLLCERIIKARSVIFSARKIFPQSLVYMIIRTHRSLRGPPQARLIQVMHSAVRLSSCGYTQRLGGKLSLESTREIR